MQALEKPFADRHVLKDGMQTKRLWRALRAHDNEIGEESRYLAKEIAIQLQREENDDHQYIEKVVGGGGGKGPAKLNLFGEKTQRDEVTCDGSADVCAHYHRYCVAQFQRSAGHHGYDDRGSGRAALYYGRSCKPNEKTHKRIGCDGQQRLSGVLTDMRQRDHHQVYGKQEHKKDQNDEE